MWLTLFKDKRILSGIVFIIVFLIIGFYIFSLKNTISDLVDKNHALELENQSLMFSNANLTKAIDIQNEAITELNLELENKNAALDETLKTLEDQYNEQMKMLEDSYTSADISSAEEAIEWLKNRRY